MFLKDTKNNNRSDRSHYDHISIDKNKPKGIELVERKKINSYRVEQVEKKKSMQDISKNLMRDITPLSTTNINGIQFSYSTKNINMNSNKKGKI